MPAVRFRTRFLHATVYDYVRAHLGELGWTTGVGNTSGDINFDTEPVRVIDYQPDERGERINVNTVSVSMGDVPATVDEELGAAEGGLQSIPYRVYLDVYMQETSHTIALCDDLRDMFENLTLQLEDKINGGFVPDVLLSVDDVVGPERPPAGSQSNEGFKRSWRVVYLDTQLYFNS
jgi:hypothetical protein